MNKVESVNITIFQAPYASLVESGAWKRVHGMDYTRESIPAQYYQVVFNGKIETASQDGESRALNILEHVYKIFNIGQRPTGYCGRSLSVGDVVKLEEKYYLCKPIGFQECDFVSSEVNYPQTKSQIDQEQIEKAKQVLIDNGIDPDETETVLQALGYVLLDKELYPESGPEGNPEVASR